MGAIQATSAMRLGQYELGERLGTGGMAEVYVARVVGPHGFAKKFAIKRILPQLARDPRFVAMFCDEARICAALSHPNIVQVVDFGEEDGELFMAMEFVDGISGAKLLRAVASKTQRFPLGAAFFIVHEVLRGLSFVHEATDEQNRPLGLVHRDVSPGNILIGKAGEVKLTDFGIVRSEFVARRTYPGELKGKLGYMSPEQVMGEEVSPRSDLFTVAIVLAEMLLTRPLFSGQNEIEILTRIHDADLRVLKAHGGHLPPVVHELLYTAMARDPADRFDSAASFAEALRTVASDCGVNISEQEFVPWLWSLGIFPSQSGTREAVSVPRHDPIIREPDIADRARAVASNVVSSMSEAGPTYRPPKMVGRVTTRYQVITPQNTRIGPLTLPDLLELVMTGKISLESQVSEDGAAPEPLARLRPLAAYAHHPAFRFGDAVSSRASWSRAIERHSLPAILFYICASQETGMLVARRSGREKRIFFRRGELRFATSTDKEELLGTRLVASGHATRAQVDDALVLSSLRGDRRLGECLVASGVLRATDLVRSLVDQLESSFIELGTWSTGHLWFVRGEQCGDEVPRAVRSGLELAARAVRSGYLAAELAQIMGGLKHEVVRPVAAPPFDRLRLGLSTAENAVFERAGAGLTIEKLIAKLYAEGAALPEDTLRAVFIGLSCGLLESPGFLLRG